MKKMLLLLVLLVAGCSGKSAPPSSSPPAPPDLSQANTANPGQALAIDTVLVKGKTTVCEFYSDNCGPCREMAPIVEQIARAHPDVAFRKLNIDRPGMGEIDFESPLATQQNIHSVPYFRIYDGEGKVSAEGPDAKEQMRTCYSQAQMFDRAQNSSEGRQLMHDYESPRT